MIERGDGSGVGGELSGLERAKIAEGEEVDAVNHPERYLEDAPDSPTGQIMSIAKEIYRGGVTSERARELNRKVKGILDDLSKVRQEAYEVRRMLAPYLRDNAGSPEAQSDTTD